MIVRGHNLFLYSKNFTPKSLVRSLTEIININCHCGLWTSFLLVSRVKQVVKDNFLEKPFSFILVMMGGIQSSIYAR